MPELTVIHIALLALTMAIGAILGWVVRSNRAEQEKAAISASWQEQLDTQHEEGRRLVEQNKGLMEQVSQLQASHTDAKNRAKELSLAVQEAFARRDELQRDIKDIRSNLEVAVTQRDQLKSESEAHSAAEAILRDKDARIDKLTLELDNWQNRLPPLIERFRLRNEEAEELESDLQLARERIRALEAEQRDALEQQTRIEPVHDPEELTEGMEASNDPEDGYTVVEHAISASELGFESVPEPEPEVENGTEPEPEPEEEVVSSDDSHDLRDDLKMIKGVGPAIEKTLHEMGIFRFQQIADMSEYDIDRVARRLKGFRTRIYREDWIGQARELRDQVAHA